MNRDKPLATLDRSVSVRHDDGIASQRLSEFRGAPAYVLLGEPGSGKSRAFELEAIGAGTTTVTARDFVDGLRPVGTSVFIDALEEYRIGEAGVDRLASLVSALTGAGYVRWRIACRAISLPPVDARRIETRLGTFATLQLEPLQYDEQRAILSVHGEADAVRLIERVSTMGADALLGNPSTLLLLRETIDRAREPLLTRGALLEEATRQMAYASDELPDDPDRPPASQIIAAAEAACIILLLSDRSDLWLLGARPPEDRFVTRDDLLAARLDTQALRAAVDTALFNGDGSSFIPTHRFVAEYLAGRALARATAPDDLTRPALSVERAIAFLRGDNDRPAPALTGVFAWFVVALSKTIHYNRALELVRIEPGAVLFHGDAAMLPTEHRRALLDAIGRDDPWFLGGNRGSAGIAGLAGADIAPEMGAILDGAKESGHRRALVLMSLAAGRLVPELTDRVHAIFLSDEADFYDRRTAGEAYVRLKGATTAVYRTMLSDIASQTSQAAMQLKIGLLPHLLPGAQPAEIREVLMAYGRTPDGVMGYGWPLSARLRKHPVPELFDAPLELKRHTGQSRFHEVASILDHALAGAIGGTRDLDAYRLLTWLQNAGYDEHDQPETDVVAAVGGWVETDPARELELVDALSQRVESVWYIIHRFEVITGRKVSGALVQTLIARVSAAEPAERLRMAQLALQTVRPFTDHPDRYWALWHKLALDPTLFEVFELLTVCTMEAWQLQDAHRKGKRAAERAALQITDREWYRDKLEEVRAGGDRGLYYPSQIYLGYDHGKFGGGEPGPERVRAWVGEEAADAIFEGWRQLMLRYDLTSFDAGRQAAGNTIPGMVQILLCWADYLVRHRRDLDVAAPLLLTIASYEFLVRNSRGEEVSKAASKQLFDRADAAEQLLSFWKGAIAGGSDRLRLADTLDETAPAVAVAVEALLRSRPILKNDLLRQALELAARAHTPAVLQSLAESALARSLPESAQRLWSFVVWSVDRHKQSDLLDCEFRHESQHELFASLFAGPLGQLAKDDGEDGVARLELILSKWGPVYAPADGFARHQGGVAGLMSGALERLVQIPSATATAAFERLVALDGLDSWRDELRHARARQAEVRRQAEFKPPVPAAIAAALVAGPPATPGDLRAVVVECLHELAHDIRHGPTSPWKGFWNRPWNQPSSPKVENDCRDLLVDRLSDRLRRFGIPVDSAKTEDRSGNDRRADILLASFDPFRAGNGPAALPIEAKRHWNSELWTAINDQLVPYCRTAGSNGHGIYLVFWFGNIRAIPAHPGGDKAPSSAGELQVALEKRLAPDLAEFIKIIVIDVSEPA